MKRILIAAILLAALAPAGARAQHCTSNIFVHTYIGNVISTPVPLACLLDDGHSAPVDYRLINPGSTTLAVQYLRDLGVPSVTGTVDGLGFVRKPITLTREVVAGSAYYISPFLTIPDGVSAAGCLTATVVLYIDDTGEPVTESSSYHTVSASCPDYP